MIVIQEVRPSASEWAYLVARCGGNPIHIPQVHLADLPEKDLVHLTFDREGTLVACAPGFRHGAGLLPFFGARALTLPTYPAGLQDSEEGIREGLQALVGHCRSMGCRRLDIGHSWGVSFQDLIPYSAYITHCVKEFTLDLDQDLSALLSGMHRNHRKNIQRARKRGIVVSVETSLSALMTLRGLQAVAAHRGDSHRAKFEVRDPKYFKDVHARVYAQGLGEVLLARVDGECVGALAYLWLAAKAITVRSGCTSKGYDEYAMYLLQWVLIEQAKERGIREINLGGVPVEAEDEGHPQHGLHEFKRGFGAKPALRTALSMMVP